MFSVGRKWRERMTSPKSPTLLKKKDKKQQYTINPLDYHTRMEGSISVVLYLKVLSFILFFLFKKKQFMMQYKILSLRTAFLKHWGNNNVQHYGWSSIYGTGVFFFLCCRFRRLPNFTLTAVKLRQSHKNKITGRMSRTKVHYTYRRQVNPLAQITSPVIKNNICVLYIWKEKRSCKGFCNIVMVHRLRDICVTTLAEKECRRGKQKTKKKIKSWTSFIV